MSMTPKERTMFRRNRDLTQDLDGILQFYNTELHCKDVRLSSPYRSASAILSICNSKDELVVIMHGKIKDREIQQKTRNFASAYAFGKETSIEYIEQNIELLKEMKKIKEELEITKAALYGSTETKKRRM